MIYSTIRAVLTRLVADNIPDCIALNRGRRLGHHNFISFVIAVKPCN
ncbi:MAG: hypothetical protein RQ867_04035 [Mariprofundaceae bacterium]|nr:hypothetical protein [Mariprofundaceae bacterium]